MSCDYGFFREIEQTALTRSLLYWFQCEAVNPPPVYDHDDERIRIIKEDVARRRELYMERNVEADELAKIWTAQGWTVHVAQRTHVGYLGPKFLKQLEKIVSTLEIGEWTMTPVESSWAVVFATHKPEDIEPFKCL